MIKEFSKYKLFRKYITSDGVNYTPIADYQARYLNLDNQCDCGYREYEYRYDSKICALELNNDYNYDKITVEGNTYTILPELRWNEVTPRGSQKRIFVKCFYGAIQFKFKGNGKNVRIHYDIAKKQTYDLCAQYVFSNLDELPVECVGSVNNMASSLSCTNFLPNVGDIEYTINDNDEHYVIIMWFSDFVRAGSAQARDETLKVSFSDNTTDIQHKTVGPINDYYHDRKDIVNIMDSSCDLWKEHAFCPSDPSIDELTGKVEYKKLETSYECGHLDRIHKKDFKVVQYDNIPKDYPRLTLVEWKEIVGFIDTGRITYKDEPTCKVEMSETYPSDERFTIIIKFKSSSNIIPMEYVLKQHLDGYYRGDSEVKIDDVDIYSFPLTSYNINLTGDENTIHELEIFSSFAYGDTRLYLPFLQKGHFYNLNQYQLVGANGEVVKDDNYYYSDASEQERWVVDGTNCNGFNKYEKKWKEMSINGKDWFRTDKWMNGNLIEKNSCDCGYVGYEYRNSDEFICGSEIKQAFTRVEGNWIIDGNTFTSNQIGHSQTTVERIYFTSNKDKLIVSFNQSSENKYDYLIVSKVDKNVVNSTSSTNNFGDAKGKSSGEFEIPIPNDGKEHFIELMYRKDSSGSASRDNVIVTFTNNLIPTSKYEIWEEYEVCSNELTGKVDYRNPQPSDECQK